MAHGDAREGKWRGKMRMEWVASNLTLYVGTRSIQLLSADPRSSAASSWLNWHPRRFKWTRPFAERPNLVSARVPSRFERAIQRYENNQSYIFFRPLVRIFKGTYLVLSIWTMCVTWGCFPTSLPEDRNSFRSVICAFVLACFCNNNREYLCI